MFIFEKERERESDQGRDREKGDRGFEAGAPK